jgi:outer membrane protein OmpA-like peptidoglycan-associated protein
MKKITALIFLSFLIQPPLCAQDAQPRQQSRQKAALLSGKVLFDTAKSELKNEFSVELNEMAALLKAYPKNKIVIEGHTDSEGAKTSNKLLSLDRANSVREFFISAGISEERIEVYGHGDEKPAVLNEDEAGKRQNRRAEILILKLE